MALKNQDFELWSGDYRILRVEITDGDNPVDLSSFTDIRWAAKHNYRSSAFTVKKSLGAGITLEASADNNIFLVELSPTDTIDLSGIFYHEAEGVDMNGNPSTLLTGEMYIHPAILKPVI